MDNKVHPPQRTSNIMDMKEHRDERGTLLPIDFDDLPFTPQGLFYISNVPNGTVRGGHAHKKCRQIFICLSGEIYICASNGVNNGAIMLYPNQSMEIPQMIWCTQEFYHNGIALVLSSEKYDEEDYIRDFEEFTKKALA